MSIWAWLAIILFSIIIGTGLTLVGGMLFHHFHKKKIKRNAPLHEEEFSQDLYQSSEKEVNENELRTNSKFREFEKLRRIATKDKTIGNPATSISADRNLQDAGILRGGLDKSVGADKKIISLPD